MPKSHRLTRRMLIQAHACPFQVCLFKEIFGEQVTVNSDSLRNAEKQGLDIEWFGRHFCKDWDSFANKTGAIDMAWVKDDITQEEWREKTIALILESL